MNYEKNYYDYIEYVKKLNRKKNKNEYFEKHHIVPRCAGGTNDKNNLILLTAREHFLAHYLLTKIYYNTKFKYSIEYSFITMRMSNNNQNRYLNSRLYESIKKSFSLEVSNRQKGQVPWNKGLSIKDKKIQEIAKKVSDKNKGKIPWNKGILCGFQSKESNIKRSETMKKGFIEGKYKRSTISSIKNKIAINNGCKNKYIKQEDVEQYLILGWFLGSLKNRRKNIEPKNKNKIAINNGIKTKYINEEELNKFMEEGWKRGGVKNRF